MTIFSPRTLISIAIIFATSVILFCEATLFAGDTSLENKIVQILNEESANGKISVGVLDFNISSINTELKMSYDQLKFIEDGLAVEFTSQLIDAAKHISKQSKISIIERRMLNEILAEKKLQAIGITEKTISEIGGIEGLDTLILGRVLVGRNNEAEIVPLPVHEVLYNWAIAKQKEGYSSDQIVISFPLSKVDPYTAKWAQSALDAGYDSESIFTAFKKAGTRAKKSGLAKHTQTDIKGLSARLLSSGPTYFIKTVKVVRVRDGKILGVAEEEKGLFKKD